MTIADRVVQLHPVVLMISFFATIVLGSVALPLSEVAPVLPLVRGIFLGGMMGLMSGWLWAVYRISKRAVGRGRPGVWDWSFAASPLIALIAGLAGWSTHNSPAAFAIFAGLFVNITLAAKGLENADDSRGKASVSQILTTAIVMYFGPIGGFWILDRKIRRVASTTATA